MARKSKDPDRRYRLERQDFWVGDLSSVGERASDGAGWNERAIAATKCRDWQSNPTATGCAQPCERTTPGQASGPGCADPVNLAGRRSLGVEEQPTDLCLSLVGARFRPGHARAKGSILSQP